MASKRSQEITLRLGVKDAETLKRALRETGEDGKKMADAIERSSREANRGLKVLDNTADEVKDEMEALAARAGVLGTALKSIGPAGLVAAASIAGIALGLGAAVRVGNDAVKTFADIGRSADRMGVAVETWQALTTEANQQGIAVTTLETGLKSLQERQSQIVTQQGELYTRLKDTNPELLKQLAALDSNEDRLRAVADAMGQAKTEQDRLRIAYAAFGESGNEVSKVLLATDGDMDKLIAKGRELGLVMDEDLIRRSEELAIEMETASRVLDLQLKQAFIDFAPVALDGIQLLGGLAKAANDLAQGMQNARERTEEYNQGVLDRKTEVLLEDGVSEGRLRQVRQGGPLLTLDDFETRSPFLQDNIETFNRIARVEFERSMQDSLESYGRALAGLTAEGLDAELTRIETEIQSRRESGAGFRIGGFDLSDEGLELETQRAIVAAMKETTLEREAATKATREQMAAETARKAAQAEAVRQEREFLALQRQAATLLAELGDATLAYTLKREELQQMVDAGLITDKQMTAELERYENQLNGVTEATQRWMQVIEGSQTETEKLEQAIIDLNSEFERGLLGDSAEAAVLYKQALDALVEALKAARQAEAESTDEAKAAIDIRKKLADVRKAAMSDAELLAMEEKRVNEIVAAGQLTRAEATEYLANYREELRKARGEVGLLARAESLLESIEQGRIRTVEDLGRAIAAMIVQIVRQAAIAQAQMGTGQGFGGFLQGLVGGIFGGGGVNPSGTPPIVAHAGVPTGHSGFVVGAGGHQLRRAGEGLSSRERMVRTEVGEEVVAVEDRRKIISYLRESSADRAMPGGVGLAGPLPLDINLKVHQSGGGGEAEVSASQSGDNSLDINVMLRDAVRGVASEGGLDSILKARGFQHRDRL